MQTPPDGSVKPKEALPTHRSQRIQQRQTAQEDARQIAKNIRDSAQVNENVPVVPVRRPTRNRVLRSSSNTHSPTRRLTHHDVPIPVPHKPPTPRQQIDNFDPFTNAPTPADPPDSFPPIDSSPHDSSIDSPIDYFLLRHTLTPQELLSKLYENHSVSTDPGLTPDPAIPDDQLWMDRWARAKVIRSKMIHAPRGPVGNEIVTIVTNLLDDVLKRVCNSEKLQFFIRVILWKPFQRSVPMKKLKQFMTDRLKHWNAGQYDLLIANLERAHKNRNRKTVRQIVKPPNSEMAELHRMAAHTLATGRLKMASRMVTDPIKGKGVLRCQDTCSKTNKPVIDVLSDKHPRARIPDLSIFDANEPATPFEEYPSVPDLPTLELPASSLDRVVSKLDTGAGLNGIDGAEFKSWLTRFGTRSENLRKKLLEFTEFISNSIIPWGAIRAFRDCRLIALDKDPGVRPIGIECIILRVAKKIFLTVAGTSATAACTPFNLCAGLTGGCEAAIHALSKLANWDDSPIPPINQDNLQPPAPDHQHPSHDPTNATIDPSKYGNATVTDSSNDITLLVDATNAFNELNRLGLLWTVRHLWPEAARLTFNCYQRASQMVIQDDIHPSIILSEEGVTQGDPLAMFLYGLSTVPIAKSVEKHFSSLVKPMFADDLALHGRPDIVSKAFEHLLEIGPPRGFYPSPSKSVIVARPHLHDDVGQLFTKLSITTGSPYLGGFIGSSSDRDAWLKTKTNDFAHQVSRVADFTTRYPQQGHTIMSISTQKRWNYVQRTVPDSGPAFLSTEAAISAKYLPNLLMVEEDEISPALRDRLSLPVRHGGIGIPRPNLLATHQFQTSQSSTAQLTNSICGGQSFHFEEYINESSEVRSKAVSDLDKSHKTLNKQVLDQLSTHDPRQAEGFRRAQHTGAFLSTVGTEFNNFILTPTEFRDGIRYRTGLPPLGLPRHCDGCGQSNDGAHSLVCQKGGLVFQRHNELAHIWANFCATAKTKSSIRLEPPTTVTPPSTGTADVESSQQSQSSQSQTAGSGKRGDVGCMSFWTDGINSIFDVTVCVPTCATYSDKKFEDLLATNESNKKKKYSGPCKETRQHFTPLCFTCDGCMGKETQRAIKRLAVLIREKNGSPLSTTVAYIRTQISISLVKSLSACLRKSRDLPNLRNRSQAFDNSETTLDNHSFKEHANFGGA